MKNVLVIPVLLFAVLLTGCVTTVGAKCVIPEPKPVLRHVVLFQWKEEATPGQVRAIEKAFSALPSKMGIIEDFEWGTDVSVEQLADGFTHCFVVSFANEADRDEYIAHPAHKAFVDLMGPSMNKVLVIDFWARD
ncbi:MAG TPA: Dabb family protein [Candidatus Hydrogenedentes bacterium]|nr:Dabb family protein [Candidatus Hydrogenedentota bacterium]HPG69145.1 Dabb family protein [Candidatus Hydrogenedentota bacterium]